MDFLRRQPANEAGAELAARSIYESRAVQRPEPDGQGPKQNGQFVPLRDAGALTAPGSAAGAEGGSSSVAAVNALPLRPRPTQRILDRAAARYSPSSSTVTRSAPRPGATVTRSTVARIRSRRSSSVSRSQSFPALPSRRPSHRLADRPAPAPRSRASRSSRSARRRPLLLEPARVRIAPSRSAWVWSQSRLPPRPGRSFSAEARPFTSLSRLRTPCRVTPVRRSRPLIVRAHRQHSPLPSGHR